jgi:urease accessory protein
MLRGIDVVSGASGPFVDEVALDYANRHRRRLVLCGSRGTQFLLDLADAAELRDGDAILLSSGEMVSVRATDEPLMEVRSADAAQLARMCWHVGNRHLAAEIGDGVLRLRADHVIAAMIEGLGGSVRYLTAPFHPEGGAYDGRATAPSHGADNPTHSGALNHGHDPGPDHG